MNELNRMSIMQHTQQFLYANSKSPDDEFYKQTVKNQKQNAKNAAFNFKHTVFGPIIRL